MYLGVYRDNTGWGEAAIRYILALDAAGVDVVCRPIKLNDAHPCLPERILQLEAKSSRGCNIVIQHILPHMMDFNGSFDANIGLYFSETDSLKQSSWNERLNCMDTAWGCNEQMREAAISSGVTVPYSVFPIPCNMEDYQQQHKPLERIRHLKDEGQFVFYAIGEMVRRKNLQGLLKAFHTEFAPEEPVGLVIKTSKSGLPASETAKHVAVFCSEIKRGLKLYDGGQQHYKKEVVITDHLSGEEMCGLHAACDCFVQPSYGEAFSLPAFDAMAFGKTPIVSDWGGYREYVTNDTGWLVPTHPEQVFGVDDSLSDLFTGYESWAMTDHASLRLAMRSAYEDWDLRQRKAQAGIEAASNFSYQKVGEAMREVLSSYEQGQRFRNHLANSA